MKVFKDHWDIKLLGSLVLLVGFLNLGSAISPALPERLHILRQLLPMVVIHGARHVVVLAGFLLILVARGVFRRKRVAWYIAFTLVAASIFLHITKGLDFEEASFSGLVVILMMVAFPRFRARSDIPTIRNAGVMFLTVLILNMLYGTIGFYLIGRYSGYHPDILLCWQDTIKLMFGLGQPDIPWHIPHMKRFLELLWMMWEVGLFIFVLMLLRPVIYRYRNWRPDNLLAGSIAQEYGKSSLVYFTLWPDKKYFFNEARTAFVAYSQVGNVAVALGDPVGPDDEIQGMIEQFNDLCRDNDWQPTYYQVLPDYLAFYRGAGFRALHIGDEAIVELQDFGLEGKRFKNLRNTLSRFGREGFRAVWHDAPLSDHLLGLIKGVSDDWLEHQGGEEKAFSLGWFEVEIIRDTPVVTVEDAQGNVLAFANYVPMYNLPQASPDLMRYSQRAPAGIMDYLFIQSILHFKELGAAEFNLGLAPLAHVGQDENSNLAEKAINILYNNFYNFKGLHDFKAKFNPRWEPRYLIYPGLVILPRVSMAIVRADNPTGLNKFLRPAIKRFKP